MSRRQLTFRHYDTPIDKGIALDGIYSHGAHRDPICAVRAVWEDDSTSINRRHVKPMITCQRSTVSPSWLEIVILLREESIATRQLSQIGQVAC